MWIDQDIYCIAIGWTLFKCLNSFSLSLSFMQHVQVSVMTRTKCLILLIFTDHLQHCRRRLYIYEQLIKASRDFISLPCLRNLPFFFRGFASPFKLVYYYGRVIITVLPSDLVYYYWYDIFRFIAHLPLPPSSHCLRLFAEALKRPFVSRV